MVKRDLEKDLELCNKATGGPWILFPEKCGPEGQWVLHEDGGGEICEVGDPYPRGDNKPQQNMEFIAAAREGWPHAIERALEAESILKKILPMAMWESCEYWDEEGVNLSTHCVEWDEVVELIRKVLGKEDE